MVWEGAAVATHVLTLGCPDRPGIVASIAQGLLQLGANIVESAQFGDRHVLHAHAIRCPDR